MLFSNINATKVKGSDILSTIALPVSCNKKLKPAALLFNLSCSSSLFLVFSNISFVSELLFPNKPFKKPKAFPIPFLLINSSCAFATISSCISLLSDSIL